MTLAADLAERTRERIISVLGLVEQPAQTITLINPAFPAPLGALRVFSTEVTAEYARAGQNRANDQLDAWHAHAGLHPEGTRRAQLPTLSEANPDRVVVTSVIRLVTIDLAFPPAGLDSCMVFVFTAPESAIPHFTLDSVAAGPHLAFHLDLIPRVDLTANYEYLAACYQPLTESYAQATTLVGLAPAQISPTQRAVMSPWMLAYRADEAAFRAIGETVDRYLDHWLTLVAGEAPPIAFGGDAASLAEHDRLQRAAIFSPAVDQVWAQVGQLVGEETAVRLRDVLREQ